MIQSASIMNCNLLTMNEEIIQLIEGGAKYLHIDVIDGHYVPNFGFPPKIISDIKQMYPDIIADVHMMVTNPADWITVMKSCGADYLSFHTDSTRCVLRTLSSIRDEGMKPGIVLNPSQRVDSVEPFIENVDMVTVLTVEPGFPGQKFLPGGVERILELSEIRKRLGLCFLISVDGGVDYSIGKMCREVGADIIISTIHTVFRQPEGIIEACRRFERELG